MEIFFLDVAQGTSQILLLGGRRAIVIDCGLANDRLVLQFLARAGIEEIECLIVSHSHDDHVGGAVSLLGEYQDRIRRICFVQDDQFLRTSFWRRISELLKTKKLSESHLVRLEVTGHFQELWADPAKALRLKVVSPSAAENLMAQAEGLQNPTSAVLILEAREQKIVFSADSEMSQWRAIHRRAGSKRMKCEILAVPHHAGRFHSRKKDLDWLFGEALEVGVAVVSVGTTNIHGHPRQDVISAMTKHGVKVLCTQITRRCHGALESLRPGVLQPKMLLGKSSATRDVTNAGNSRNVACAGTVRVEAGENGFVIDRLTEHQQAVDRLSSTGEACPLCRAGTSGLTAG